MKPPVIAATLFALWGCAASDPQALAAQAASEENVMRQCAAEDGTLRQRTQLYYHCVLGNAVRLESSGASASEIALASRSACSEDMSKITTLAGICRAYYADVADYWSGWAQTVSNRGDELVTQLIVEHRAKKR